MNNEKGFTLLELLLSLAIFSMVTAGVMSSFWLGNNTWEKQTEAAQVQRVQRSVINTIAKDVRFSDPDTLQIKSENGGINNVLELTSGGEDLKYHIKTGTNELYRTATESKDIGDKIITVIQFEPYAKGVQTTLTASIKGRNYTLSSITVPRVLYALAAIITPGAGGGDAFVLTSADGEKLIVSNDGGETWEVVSMPPTDGVIDHTPYINDLVYNNGTYVLVGDNSSNAMGASTGMGITDETTGKVTWQTWDTALLKELNAIEYGGPEGSELYVTVGDQGRIRYSSTGEKYTWVDTQVPLVWLADLYGLAWGNGRFVAVGEKRTDLVENRNGFKTSMDGINWSESDNDYADLNSVTFSPVTNTFIACGNTGTILVTSDGNTWSSKTSGINNKLNCITWGEDKFIAVGQSGTIITSGDGNTWDTSIDLGDENQGHSIITTEISTANIISIECINGLYVATVDIKNANNESIILTSKDGFAWKEIAVANS